MNGLFAAMERAARQARPRIAVGVIQDNERLRTGLIAGQTYAEVVTVGVHVDTFDNYDCESPNEIAAKLFELSAAGIADGVVRGQVDYTSYHRQMNEAFDLKPARHGMTDIMCPYLLRDSRGDEWFITPMVQHDDASVEGKVYLVSSCAAILEAFGVEPKVGVLAGDNLDERGYLASVDQSIDDAEIVVGRLRGCGIAAEFFGLRIDEAATHCNVVVPIDGTTGNFIYRSLGYIGGAELVGGVSLTNRLISLDTSRYNDSFGLAILGASAFANIGGVPVKEYN